MAIPCLLFEHEYKFLNRENTSEEGTSKERTSVEGNSVKGTHGNHTLWAHTGEAHTGEAHIPGAHISEDMARDFQLNAFKFTGRGIALTGDSIEDAILNACCVLKERCAYNEVILKDGNTELSAVFQCHPLPSCGASSVQEQAEVQETHMDSSPAVPMKTQELPVSVKSPLEEMVESTKVEECPKHDSKVMDDGKGQNKLRNVEKENEHHLEFQDTAVQSFSVEELVAKASAGLESAPPAKISQATAAQDLDVQDFAGHGKAEHGKVEQDKAEHGKVEQVCFGTFEEDFFNSYVPPSQPLTEEELLEMKDGVSPNLCFKGSQRTVSKRRHKNKPRGFMGWLTAVFYS